MTRFLSLFFGLVLWSSLAGSLGAAVVFQDGFESGSLSGEWSASGTNDGRATVTSNHVPATGQWHLVLDDGVSDAIYSVAEATLNLNLGFKKNVVLNFKAKSLGNEPNSPPSGNFTSARTYDGVAISADGGATWRSVQSLANVGTTWQSYSVSLDAAVAALGGSFGANFRIRFSEYDNAPAPTDGIALDDVLITADDDLTAVVEMPSPLFEGTGPYTGYVLLSFTPSQPITFNITSAPSGQLSLPATVTVDAGQTGASFDFSVLEDSVANLTRTVSVNAVANGISTTPGTVTIYDDEAPIPTLSIPAQLTEGSYPSNNASLSVDRPPAVAMTMLLTANPANEVSLPGSVTIPAGQTQVFFTITAVDDSRIDGSVAVTVTASASGIQSTSAQTLTVDNEQKALSLTTPTIVQEGLVGNGTVKISGTLTAPLTVNLSSSNPSSATVPPTVVIPAGATAADFTITAPENNLRDGSRNVTISASAATFTSTSASVIIRDNEVAGYVFSDLTDLVNVTSPIPITISAADIEGNPIYGVFATINLLLVLPDGSTQPVSPASAQLNGGSGWSGNVTLPAIAAAPLRLRISDNGGNTSDSKPFDILRVLPIATADLVWDGSRGRIYASVPTTAGGSYANQVIAIDPVNLQVTGNVTTNQDPGQLALTSGREFLYTALNGNGTVAKIDLSSFSVAQTFAIGSSQFYGTLYAEDISTVTGQPNLLVVSQYRKGVSPRHNGVAVYDNGVIRPNKTQDHTGSNRIEPSADPNIFFGYNNETTEYGFRRLQLDANGMTQLTVNTTLLSGFSLDMVADGNIVVSTSGVEVDGANMRRLGAFNTSGAVRPDLSGNRVYFVEPQSSFSSLYDKIAAYEPTTFSLIRRLTMPAVTGASSLIRWGTNGLAFRTGTSVVLVNSGQLVPSDPPADLAVNVQASPNPATAGAPLSYAVQLTNQGPNLAHNTVLTAVLSDSQTLQNVSASAGSPTVSGSTITLSVGDLAAGSSIALNLTTTPQSAGSLSCTASVNSTAIDSNFSNNTGFKLVSVGFQSAADSINQLRLNANNLIYDSSRNLLWASIPNTVDAPLGRSVVSINPVNGLISDPIPINANPRANCIALSANGRYLYLGLSDSPELHRIDLTANPPSSVRIPLGLNQWGDAAYAEDIEVLDGDGTSFLLTTYGDDGAAVYDGAVRRPTRSGIYTSDRIERTSTANVFASYQNYSSGFQFSRLTVNASGVTATQTASNVIGGYYVDIRGAGNLVVSSSGLLADSSTLSLKANLGVAGRPCLDLLNGRAYIVNGNGLRGFDTATGTATGTLTLPTTAPGDWAQDCVRWGLDGFAILGTDSKIYLARWSSTIPAGVDRDGDFIPDAWEATYFGSLGFSASADPEGDGLMNAFEYLFVTSPTTSNGSPLGFTAPDGNGAMHLIFPRRASFLPNSYRYETTADLQQWSAASGVVETILNTQTINGVQVQTIDAAIPAPAPGHAFARIKWLAP